MSGGPIVMTAIKFGDMDRVAALDGHSAPPFGPTEYIRRDTANAALKEAVRRALQTAANSLPDEVEYTTLRDGARSCAKMKRMRDAILALADDFSTFATIADEFVIAAVMAEGGA